MENLIQNIPMAISVILPVVLVLMVITNIIVEVLKKLTWGKLPTNILAFAVAMAVTLLVFLAACRGLVHGGRCYHPGYLCGLCGYVRL